MLDILAITGPIYLCIVLGYVSVWRGWFAPADLRVLGRFVVQFALPALLFNAIASRSLGEVLNPSYLVAYALGSVSLLLGALWFARRVGGHSRSASATVAMGMCCSNSGYVGYPVLMLTMGPIAGVVLALNMLVENLFKIPLLLAVGDSEGQAHANLWHTLRQTAKGLATNPMIACIVLGLLFTLLGWQLPGPVARTVNLFASASTALSLFVIGGTLVGLQVRGLRRQVAQIVFGKLVLHPLLVLAAVAGLPWMGLPPLSAELRTGALLMAAMPMMGIYTILAQRHGHQAIAAASLLVATVVSFFTLSGLLWVLKAFPT
ncbi:AEC family transporter [Hydrogenophaga sp. OTU3427]|uniref:AEC family transporter n=1 Tax=Hydrogenophaga sp. OTU3427 TaxID=3043856 RepID=UPI00313C1FFC